MSFEYSETYLYKLHKLTKTLDRVFDQVLRKHVGIGLSQFILLLAIDQYGSTSQRKVSTFLEISPGAISRQVEISSRKGWIRITSNKNDRRGQLISLTTTGETMITQGIDVLDKYVFKIFDDHDRGMGLMGHIDILLNNTKGVIAEQSSQIIA